MFLHLSSLAPSLISTNHKLTLANGPKPSRTTRRFPLFEDATDPRESRLAIIKLHAEGWSSQHIAITIGLWTADILTCITWVER